MKLVVLALVLFSSLAQAEQRARWLREHALAEWAVGTGGWRTGIGVDVRAPGFEQVGGGGELTAGLEVTGGVGLFASGRVLAGGGYLEGLAGIGVQLRVSERVRLRAGPAVGQATLGGDRAVMVGGFAVGSIDLFPLGGGRIATALSLRVDVDSMIGARTLLPDSSLGLSAGLGLRY